MPRKFIQNKVQDVCNIVRTRIKSKICCGKIVDLRLSVSFINDAIYEFTSYLRQNKIIDVYQLCCCQYEYKQEFSTHGYDEILYPHSVKHFVKETQPKNEYFHHKCRLILGFN